MIQTKLLRLPILLISGLILFAVGCGTNSDTGMGTLEVRMHDAPIDSADQVNVNIERVEVNREGSQDGWSTISEPQETYNLLELTNGAYTVLGDTTLEAGTYQQIRLILADEGHNVVIDGETHEMMVPSGSQTGVKLNVNAEIEENITYILLLDFDASRSVVKAGQSNSVSYLLQPVIRATNLAVTGNIAGTVAQAEAKPVVYAISGSDTLSTTIADTTSGEFTLMGLEGGTYDVAIDPRNEEFSSSEETGVSVTEGENNDIGTIELSQK
ncbi:DUF4382 domain-containing protein [Aliifodinibius sp. S!AR15-10]|uniref:DUF4382 domain-containing protein n=1 Tax=Aliifodinibius sp. S!AR15-10 TaxID=2950437 RepID=UPI00285B64CB|nr:DUF4382 domain-containing protein [Aliifodinibius sp. S!AR15-10]MDR8391144.1 DUF4382 domain-containing protein [Aliifodinibius sp. S!AR15-10]